MGRDGSVIFKFSSSNENVKIYRSDMLLKEEPVKRTQRNANDKNKTKNEIKEKKYQKNVELYPHNDSKFLHFGNTRSVQRQKKKIYEHENLENSILERIKGGHELRNKVLLTKYYRDRLRKSKIPKVVESNSLNDEKLNAKKDNHESSSIEQINHHQRKSLKKNKILTSKNMAKNSSSEDDEPGFYQRPITNNYIIALPPPPLPKQSQMENQGSGKDFGKYDFSLNSLLTYVSKNFPQNYPFKESSLGLGKRAWKVWRATEVSNTSNETLEEQKPEPKGKSLGCCGSRKTRNHNESSKKFYKDNGNIIYFDKNEGVQLQRGGQEKTKKQPKQARKSSGPCTNDKCPYIKYHPKYSREYKKNFED